MWLSTTVGFLTASALLAVAQLSVVDVGDSEATADNPLDIANRTYAEEQTALQRHIFKNYSRTVRPVRNRSLPLIANAHVYLMHYSVQEAKQSMRLYGHIYLTWFDEMAVWDPTEFNNVKTTLVSQWQLWQPEIRVANSIAGVNQYFEISKRSHASLTSMSPEQTKVEIYPTFSITIGCNFDFTLVLPELNLICTCSFRDYPFDEQDCSLRLYTSHPMNEVELKVYYDLQPSVMLSWSNETNKKQISSWELKDVTANITYYRNRQYNNTRPLDAITASSTWTILVSRIRILRNSSKYWFALAIPAFMAMLFNSFTFLLFRIELSLMVIVANFFLQLMLMYSELSQLPPSVGEPPKIVRFFNYLMVMTMTAMIMHLWLRRLVSSKRPVPKEYVNRFREIVKQVRKRSNGSNGVFSLKLNDLEVEGSDSQPLEEVKLDEAADVDILYADLVRKLCIILYFFFTLVFSIFLLL